ncbi:hypothetical protein Cantr_00446 [Candida viswanathii]|uniref:CsbD-like domain-containing protein n=1 Tax=Candida viswanathii TaxID=5486 RepID=A0A367YH13_9ASCO|nr:hypothetical protein Cantr_00446 [Candida viswanathii]
MSSNKEFGHLGDVTKKVDEKLASLTQEEKDKLLKSGSLGKVEGKLGKVEGKGKTDLGKVEGKLGKAEGQLGKTEGNLGKFEGDSKPKKN